MIACKYYRVLNEKTGAALCGRLSVATGHDVGTNQDVCKQCLTAGADQDDIAKDGPMRSRVIAHLTAAALSMWWGGQTGVHERLQFTDAEAAERFGRLIAFTSREYAEKVLGDAFKQLSARLDKPPLARIVAIAEAHGMSDVLEALADAG